MKVKSFYLLFTVYCLLFTASGCGYQLIGSKSLPFDSITIKHVKNKTYEPRLEDRLHNALSKEFIAQGINVVRGGADVELTATITRFELSAIAIIEENVQEQSIIMQVDIRIVDKGSGTTRTEKVTEFSSMESPIKITFQSTGSISDAVAQKEKAADKACTEIAREIIGKIIIKYAQ